ncbi:MAG: hypothetical protein IGS38_10280 [Synechococcales cyanobacterium M58_A2018_015]|nr:hypothetical protein [Synechococcales cyanobacterium M58_A2018_015]
MQLSRLSSFPIAFDNGKTARIVRLQGRPELPEALAELGLDTSRPVLVLVGGASNLAEDDYRRLQTLFVETLAPLAEALGVVVIDGGTNAGVMQLMGQAREQIGGTFPLMGVAPSGKVHVSSSRSSTASQYLEPHHTHFILVPGSKWGDESHYISEIASLIAGESPSVTVLINGGQVSLQDVESSIAEDRPVVVIAGTGRLADDIAAALRNPQSAASNTLAPVLQRGRFQPFDLAQSGTQLHSFLQNYFRLQFGLLPHPNVTF